MSDAEILEKAIQKAVDGGWDFFDKYDGVGWEVITGLHGSALLMLKDESTLTGGVTGFDYQAIIFNHDFAKALWGERKILRNVPHGVEVDTSHPGWQYHLQQMVIADDPIKYLGDNLDG